MRKYNKDSIQIPLEDKLNFYYPNEIFMDVTDFAVPGVYDYYMISTYGRVYHKYLGIFLKQAVSGSGYIFVVLSTAYGPKPVQIHRLILLTFNPIENCKNLQVNHINGNKQYNFPNNLEWCTRSENMRHAYANGLHKRDTNLSEDIVITICELLKEEKYTNKEIANIVGNNVTDHIVSDIKKKSSWSYLTKNYEFNHRPGKLFDDQTVQRICQYFQNNNKGNLSIKDHSKNALISIGLEASERNVDTTRKIYTRKYYTNISNNYIF